MVVLSLRSDAGGLEPGGELLRDDDGAVAAAAAGDVDVDAEVAAWQVQEGQCVVQAALDDPLETGSGATYAWTWGARPGVARAHSWTWGARPVEWSIRSVTTGSLGV